MRAETPAAKPAVLLLLRGLWRNLAAGLHLAAFAPVSRYDFRVSAGDFVLLWTFNLYVGAAMREKLRGIESRLAEPGQ